MALEFSDQDDKIGDCALQGPKGRKLLESLCPKVWFLASIHCDFGAENSLANFRIAST